MRILENNEFYFETMRFQISSVLHETALISSFIKTSYLFVYRALIIEVNSWSHRFQQKQIQKYTKNYYLLNRLASSEANFNRS